MKDRIAHIMRAKNLKASDFAALLGIQPSGISHILSGRNQPSLDFVKKIKETFPEYNLDWIILGVGPMTTSEPFLFKPSDPISDQQIDFNSSSNPETPELVSTTSTNLAVPPTDDSSPIKTIMILYRDGTFESFNPR